ncbi:MAG TPA: tetratricopeptide repeat protein [Vicinamibacterales bacterium]|nr:tetratricopeptide repeat protein [Vicinamibacterales bacterium]
MIPIQSLEEQATGFAKRGDFGMAARQVNEELTKAAPANAAAWTRLGRCCLELGQLDEATAALDQALELNPQNTIASSLLQEVGRRRAKLSAAIPPVKKPRATKAAAKTRTGKADKPLVGGFGRPEFATLGQLPAAAATEALAPRIEAILMALSDRPFAEKIVEARNRAAQSGGKLFRRNSFYPGGPGHIYAFQHGGRWEPQINIGFFADSRFGRHAIRAGIGFNLAQGEVDLESSAGLERVLAHFERFQQLVGSEWRQMLADWMGANGGFIQSGTAGPALDTLPKDAVDWLATTTEGRELGWVFCGRWLFADRGADAEIMESAAKLTKTLEQTFSDLLPLWTSVYRGA